MNLSEIKNALGVSQLNLSIDYKSDAEGKVLEPKEKTGWLRMWQNDQRRAIVIHEDVVAQIQDENQDPNLDLKEPITKTGSKGEYTLVTIFAFKPADVSL